MTQIIHEADATGRSTISESTSGHRATRFEEFVYLFFILWTMVGLCLDGWAHRHQPELESFFTPWHAVFYTGFIFSTIWLARMVIARRPQSASLRQSIPDGYGLAVVGLAVFAVGGVGDGLWHTYFGVETSLDALLSPTHLLMLVGMLGGGTAPVRAAWRNSASAIEGTSLGQFLPPVLAVAVSTTGVAFFFLYANGFNNWQMTNSYIPGANEMIAASGILSTLASTAILLGPTMLILKRWKPPFGTFTIIFGMVGGFMSGLDAFEFSWQVLAPLAGGLAADMIVASPLISRGSGGQVSSYLGAPLDSESPLDSELRRRAWTIGVAVPLMMWTVSTVAIWLAWGVGWPPELWAGQIVMAMLLGFSLAVITHPPARPAGLKTGS